jgi:acyl transferase domain-containing protein
MIPPHRNFTRLNPAINLDAIPAVIPLEPQPWRRDAQGDKPRIVGVSSFGITGTDAHAIIQEAPLQPVGNRIKESLALDIPMHILKLSAKTEEALDKQVKQYGRFLESSADDGSMRDIEYTANTGRTDFQYRTAIVGKTKEEMWKGLQSATKNTVPDIRPSLCFLFTGQGSQYFGMAKALYDASPIFKAHFDKCDEMLSSSYRISIRNAIWGKNASSIGRTIYSQTSVVEYCMLKLWKSWGVKLDFVLGYSLGEFAAAVAAGILSFEDALKLVAERSPPIDSLPGGKMIVLKADKESVYSLMKRAFTDCNRWLDYAAENAMDQIVLAGSEENVQYFGQFCKNNGKVPHFGCDSCLSLIV